MRAYKFLHQLMMRFSGMDESEGDELQTEARQSYHEVLDSAKDKERQNRVIREENVVERARADGAGRPFVAKKEIDLDKWEKAVMFLEKWPVRYAVAGFYIGVVPQVKRYFEGDMEEGGPQMTPEEIAAMMSMWQRMNSFNRK